MALPEPTLIKSIFNRHGPAHDGALVLSKDRLSRMGCILPLSERENILNHYGTRHRAALGLSEQTDAVCLVVSEERGEVSTIVGGEITTWNNPKTLANKLNDWINFPEIPGPTLKGFFKGAFVMNWSPKLGALTLVTIAWLVLASQQQVKTSIMAPVRYVDTPSEMVVGEESTKVVRLALSGRRHSIKAVGEQEVRVQVSLGNIAAGAHKIGLSAKNIDLPLGVIIDRVTPRDIKVILKLPEH